MEIKKNLKKQPAAQREESASGMNLNTADGEAHSTAEELGVRWS